MRVWFFFHPHLLLPYTMSKNEIEWGLGENFIGKKTTKLVLKTADSKTMESLEAQSSNSKVAMFHW